MTVIDSSIESYDKPYIIMTVIDRVIVLYW